MHTGTSPTGPQRPAGGGRPTAVLVGVGTFALVFLLIVGGTVGYLALRPGGGPGTTTATPSSQAPSSPGATTATPTEEERCWTPESNRTSSNPPGRLRGGGLEFTPPAGFDGRAPDTWAQFLTDVQTATAPVEQEWASALTIGAVSWQEGVEYPGEEAASERIFTCLYSNGAAFDGSTSGRSMHEQATERVTVDGMTGYLTTGELRFAEDTLEKTDASRIWVVVVDTPEGPTAFVGDIAVGVPEHEQALQDAFDSLTGISG